MELATNSPSEDGLFVVSEPLLSNYQYAYALISESENSPLASETEAVVFFMLEVRSAETTAMRPDMKLPGNFSITSIAAENGVMRGAGPPVHARHHKFKAPLRGVGGRAADGGF